MRYWRMTPDELDAVPDELFRAMDFYMRREAAELRAARQRS